jgi:hypothetical protein
MSVSVSDPSIHRGRGIEMHSGDHDQIWGEHAEMPLTLTLTLTLTLMLTLTKIPGSRGMDD